MINKNNLTAMKNHINIVSAEEAVKFVKSNQRVFIHGSAATPAALLQALAKRKHELKNVEVGSITTLGEMPLADKSCKGSFYLNVLI